MPSLHTVLQQENPTQTITTDIEWVFIGFQPLNGTTTSPLLSGTFKVNGSQLTFNPNDLVGGGYNPFCVFENPGIYILEARATTSIYLDPDARLTINVREAWNSSEGAWKATNDDDEIECWFS